MRGTKMAFLCTFAALAALAMLLPLTARAEIIFLNEYGDRYISFTAGSPLTITVSAPHYSSTGSKMIYDWKWDDYAGGDSQFTPIATTSVPSVSVTPTAADHQRMISLDIIEEGNDRGGIGLSFILLDNSIPHPVVTQESGYFEYDLFLGQSITLAVPEATADVGGKTLVYEWFQEMAGGGDRLVQRGGSNKLTVTNDGTQDPWAGYFCRASYQEDEKSEINYNIYFSIDFYFYEPEDYKIVTKETVEEVPNSIGEALDNKNMTVAQLELHVFKALSEKSDLTLKKEAAKLYDVTLQVREGGTWVPATKDNFPRDGLLVILPYPEGTDRWNYEFSVAHICEMELNGYEPGDIENPYVEKTSEGLKVRLSGLSPVMIAWEQTGSQPPAASAPMTGDSTPLGCIAALLAASACAMAVLGWMLRRRRT